jgi:NEDD8-activating enzyme E1
MHPFDHLKVCCVLLNRVQDVGKSKAEVAAKRVMERVSGVNIVPHFCRIEDKELEFYSQFHIIVLGLDSIEARSYINSVACGFLGMYFYANCFVIFY